ncbi:MAG: DUF1127 domain-containing protein [Rhodobacteraceae bacterium]|nr:DUF1127 domain-containing protein [Paracoccaceae bacterium]
MTHAVTHHHENPLRGFMQIPGLGRMISLYAERRALAKLNETALKDIGLTRREAKLEAERAPWDAPAHWRR